VHSASWVHLRSCLKEEVAAPVQTAGGIRHADHVATSIRKIWHSIHRQVVPRLVLFARGLRPRSLVSSLVFYARTFSLQQLSLQN
jgi:hypothetical protein